GICNSGNAEYNFSGRHVIDYMKSKPLDGSNKSKKQKKIIKLVIDKVLESSTKEFLAIISDSIQSIETSLKTKELVGVGLSCMKIGVDNINKKKFPLKADLNKVQVESEIRIECNLENTTKEIYAFLNNN
ncbi:MAG: hypothetical protein ACRDA5_02195, partial [Clostridium sp.]